MVNTTYRNPTPLWALVLALVLALLAGLAIAHIDTLLPLVVRLVLMMPRGLLVPIW
jgi:hypothetical protein